MAPCYLVKPEDCVRDMACLKRLEPAVVHQYCEMMLARAVPAVALAEPVEAKDGQAASVVVRRVKAVGKAAVAPKAGARKVAASVPAVAKAGRGALQRQRRGDQLPARGGRS